jgi:serine/threonine protein kinase
MAKGKILEIDGVSYTVESQLGQGGTATVFKVRSSADDKVYALKRIGKDRSSQRNERFRQEIAFGMASRNDHVVRIHAQDEDDDYLYYTMDLYSKSLRDVIAEDSDHQVLLDYLSQLCDGLAYVHDQGVVHRDIKPENILVDTESRRLVLADFGIAHFKDSSLTQEGDLLANRNYQAPEQMGKKDARDIGKPADIFALGLIITEVFTKQNSRGARHRRVGDIYPFLSNLDLLVERMMLQDETQRLTVQAARDSLNLIRKQLDSRIEEIMEDLRHDEVPTGEEIRAETDLVLKRAGIDVLSAKHIFERTTDEELARYNLNYHCEISYRVSDELYNGCVHSKLYSICKAKFENESQGGWREANLDSVVSPLKAQLQSEFESIQHQYPLGRNSIWEGLPFKAANYFRFCKDYHCKEIIESARRVLAVTPYADGSLHENLMNAPILWIASRVRDYLKTDIFEMSQQNLQQIEFERHVSLHWEETDLEDSYRKTIGTDLFDLSEVTETIAILEEIRNKWDVSYAKQADGRYSIHFRSRDEYELFRKQALAVAAPDHVFEGDVLDLLRPEDEYDDLVALIWEPTFDIPNTVAKVLGLREI